MRILLLLAWLSVCGLSACATSDSPQETIVVKKSNIVKKCIGVEGMTCVGCEVTLEDNVSKIKGVVKVKASSKDDEATIEYDSTQTDFLSITNAIKEAGYKTTFLKK